MIKLLETFAGVGGFRLALEQAIGKDNINCIGYSEIDKFAKQVYDYRFPGTNDLGSISEIDINGLEDFDLLVGGFPCQDVSVAGKQNLEGGRTVLVEYLLQMLEKKQPKYFVFENVKGLMSKKFDIFRESIFERISKAGYICTFEILNTKDFGLPQNRERIFIVGKRVDLQYDFNFPKGQELTTFLKDILEKEVDEKYYLSEKALSNVKYKRGDKHKGQVDLDGITGTLTASMYKGYGNDGCSVIRQLNNPKHSNNRIYGIDGISPTLNTMQGGNRQPFINTEIIRKLTPIECERLQGFPDGWSSDIVSNTQAYKQMGNAISVPVVKAIFKNLFTHI